MKKIGFLLRGLLGETLDFSSMINNKRNIYGFWSKSLMDEIFVYFG